MYLGAHVSAAGGIFNAIPRALDLSAECMQIFVSSPRVWAVKPVEDKIIARYREELAKTSLGPTLVHAKYLISLATYKNPEVHAKSEIAIKQEFEIANKIKARGMVFHLNSHNGAGFEAIFNQFCDGVKKVLETVEGDAKLLMETSAGSANHIGSSFEELTKILEEVKNPRLGICIDTQHIWAAGYDLVNNIDKVCQEIKSTFGFENIHAVHFNDSKKDLASKVDRHENIGDGLLGNIGLKNVLNVAEFNELPFYLEVPGIDKTGPDAENVRRMKELRNSSTK